MAASKFGGLRGGCPAAVLAGVLAVVGGTPAHSHEVTILPLVEASSARLRLYYGDPGSYGSIEKTHLVELGVFDSNGVKISFLRDIESGADGRELGTPPLRLGDWPAGTYLAESRYDNGFFVHDGENRAIATTKEWFPAAIDSAHYLKFSKALFRIGASSAGFDRVVGHRLELIPRADPFALKDGESLAVEVRFDDVPLANVLVEVGDEASASRGSNPRSDDRGIVRILLNHKGTFRLAAGHRSPSNYPALYAYDDYAASLVFSR